MTHLSLKTVSLGQLLAQGRQAECTFQGRGRSEELQIVWVQLAAGQLVVTTSHDLLPQEPLEQQRRTRWSTLWAWVNLFLQLPLSLSSGLINKVAVGSRERGFAQAKLCTLPYIKADLTTATAEGPICCRRLTLSPDRIPFPGGSVQLQGSK